MGLVFGTARVLGNRPTALPGFVGPARVSITDTVAVQRGLNASASNADILAQQMRNPNSAVTVAYGLGDPRRTALLYRPGYISMIQRSLAANAPLSPGDAQQIAGSGVDLTAGLAPLAVIDRINALDESWGSALEAYRRTFQVPLEGLKLRVKYINAGWGWKHPKTSKSLDMDGIRRAVSLGPVVFYDRMNRVLQTYTMQEGVSGGVLRDSQGRMLTLGDLETPQGAGDVEITEETPTATTYYPARLAAIRATTEALIWGRDVLRPYMAVVLDDTTGNLTTGWMSLLATYQVTREDVQAMAQQIAQSQQPRPSAWDNFVKTMGVAVSVLVGGVDFIQNVGDYAQNLSNAPSIDWEAAGREAGNLANQALSVYGAGVRLSGTETGGIEGASIVSAPLSPEEGRLLNWLSKSPPMVSLAFPAQTRNPGSSVPVPSTVTGSFLRGLGGGGVSARAFFERLGSTTRFEEAVRAGGALQGSANLLNTPGAVSLKCLLLARRWPMVLGGQFAQVFLPIHGALQGIA